MPLLDRTADLFAGPFSVAKPCYWRKENEGCVPLPEWPTEYPELTG